MLIRTAIVVAVAWLPLALLALIRGRHNFLSFVSDYATQSRFLLVIPVLILGVAPLHERYALVAHHFEKSLVPDDEKARFQSQWQSHERLQDNIVARVIVLLITYAFAIWGAVALTPHGSEFLNWWIGSGGYRYLSTAGTWALFVSYPILVYLTLHWLWRQFVWARFLHSTTQLNLRLIAAHPDKLGGMGFLEASLLGQLPFSFCLGVGLAGAIANRVFNEGQKVMAYRLLAPVLIAIALLIAVAPYFLFTPTLMQMRRRGMLKYGAFAQAVGEQFELKWLNRDVPLTQDVLLAPDFSATSNLYAVARNIEDIRIVPVAAVSVYAFVIAALIPCIPVFVAALPFDVILKAAMKLLF